MAKPKADKRPPKIGSSESNSKDNLTSIPMPELLAKLNSSSDGLSQDEAQKRLMQFGLNEIAEKKSNPFLKLLTYFWGPIPWMIEAAVILSAIVHHWLDFFHYSSSALLERRRWILGRTPGRQRHRRAESKIGNRRPRFAGWEVGQS